MTLLKAAALKMLYLLGLIVILLKVMPVFAEPDADSRYLQGKYKEIYDNKMPP